jgi:uncharacterized membrane protein
VVVAIRCSKDEEKRMWFIKVLHVLAVVVLLGNLLMAPFWRKRLVALGGVQARAEANRSVRVADLIFTLPGWVLVLVTGIMLIIDRGSMRGGWLHLSLLLFLGWLILWHMLVLRARKAMLAQAEEAASGGQAAPELAQHERQWQQWSYISAGIVILILILMTAQPF